MTRVEKMHKGVDVEDRMVSYYSILSDNRELSKTEEDVISYICTITRHLNFASDDFTMMDYAMFITPSKEGYNISHLEFTHEGSCSLKMLNNVNVSNLNDSIKVIEAIFNEKTSIICEQENIEDINLWYRSKENIVIGVLLTRFKNSNDWLEFFIEGKELELALHKDFDICIDHILVYYSC